MAAKRPLTKPQIIRAVRVNTNGKAPELADKAYEQQLLSLCNNLLTIDSEEKIWRFTHPAVGKYLELKMQWTLSRADFHAASACMSAMVH
jgi:hypothetical protein